MFPEQLPAFGEQFRRLAAVFPRAVTPEAIEVWFDAMRDLSLDEASGGARVLIETRSRREGFPTPGDWREAAESHRQAKQAARHAQQPADTPPASRSEATAFLASMRSTLASKVPPWSPRTRAEHHACQHYYALLDSVRAGHPTAPIPAAALRALTTFGGLGALQIIADGTPDPAESMDLWRVGRKAFVAVYLDAVTTPAAQETAA